jgi:hypothetical protein
VTRPACLRPPSHPLTAPLPDQPTWRTIFDWIAAYRDPTLHPEMDRQMRHFGYGHAWPEAGRHNYQLTSSAVDVRVQYWPDFDVSIWVLFGACALGWRQVATWETPGGIAAQVAEARWMAAWAVSPHALNDFRQLDYEQNGVGAKPPAETSKRSESASNTLATLESRILDYMASHKQPLSAGEIRDGLGANFGVVGTQLIQMANAGTVAVTSEGHGNEYSLPEPANNSNTQ